MSPLPPPLPVQINRQGDQAITTGRVYVSGNFIVPVRPAADQEPYDGGMNISTSSSGNDELSWIALGGVSALLTTAALLFITQSSDGSKLRPYRFFLLPILAGILRVLFLLACCFPLDSAAMGPSTKSTWEVAALLAKLLSLDHGFLTDAVFCLLVSSTAQCYVSIKCFYTVELRDVLFAILMQSSVYWTPYALVWFVLLVCGFLIRQRRCAEPATDTTRGYERFVPEEEIPLYPRDNSTTGEDVV